MGLLYSAHVDRFEFQEVLQFRYICLLFVCLFVCFFFWFCFVVFF